MNNTNTAKHNVLHALARAKLQNYLLINGYTYLCKDGWVPGHVLLHASIGGEEGKRRKRDLDEDGWLTEKRKMLNSKAYEYRLICTKHEAQRIIFNNSNNIIPEMIYGSQAHQIGIFE